MAQPEPPDDDDDSSPRRRPWVLSEREIEDRFIKWPLLRLLLLDPLFRYAFLACALVVLLIVVCVPKVWVVTPPGMLPKVRVSVLDFAQARVHALMARRKEAAGDRVGAAQNWRMAVANHPAAEPLIGGALSNLIALPSRSTERSRQALQQSFWLLRLTGTNRDAFDLTVRVLEHYRFDDLLLAFITNAPPANAREHQRSILKALLRQGLLDAYAARREEAGPALTGDPEIALFDAAWKLSRGNTGPDAAAEATLSAAARESERAVIATELQLLVAARRGELETYGQSLARLRDLHADTPSQHAVHWLLLHRRGNRDEAARRALEFADPPINSVEVSRLSQAMLTLGLTNHALKFLEHFAPQLGTSADTWATLAELLAQQRRWPDLRGFAVELRRNPLTRSTLMGFSYFFDGLAAHGEGRTEMAAAEFARMVEYPFPDDGVAYQTALKLARMDHPAPARDLLLARRERYARSLAYWQHLVRIGSQLRDADLLLLAAEQGYELEPNRMDTLNDYSAALLIHRKEPATILNNTRRLVQASPQSIPARMNYALALLLNDQPASARAILLTFDPEKLTGLERTVYHFARAQLLTLDDDLPGALGAIQQVDTSLLFPPQAAWLNELRDRLESRLHPPEEPAGQ